MKILLLNPPYFSNYSRQSRSPCVTKGGTIYYPYFLAYTAGVLEKEKLDVKLVDAVANKLNHKETIELCKSYNPELIVIDTSTPSINNDIEISNKIKENLPNSHITMVGTHPSNLPEWTLNNSNIDSVCVGEHDYTVLDLALSIEKNKDLSKVAGLIYKKYGKIFYNKKRELISNLDELPFVSSVYKKHLDIRRYFYASLRWPQITILTARGCPYNCSFCNSPFKNSYRTRGVEDVIEEMKFIKNELPYVKEIMIEDETFPANRDRTNELCDEIIKKKIKIKWSCNARVDTDHETLKNMKNADCRLLCVGFESPYKEALDNVGKRTSKQMQIEFMNNTKKLGLLVNGCFMIGLPGDTKKTIRETIEWAKKLNPDTAQFYPIMIYPGTVLYNWAKKNSFLNTNDFSKWLTLNGLHNCVVDRPGMNGEELVSICDNARKEFYIRKKYIISKFAQCIKNPLELQRTMKSANIFLRYMVRK